MTPRRGARGLRRRGPPRGARGVRRGAAGARVLIPRAREARAVLPDTLREHGALVDVLPVYDTLPADELAVPVERIEAADFITFTSSSTVRAS